MTCDHEAVSQEPKASMIRMAEQKQVNTWSYVSRLLVTLEIKLLHCLNNSSLVFFKLKALLIQMPHPSF